MPKTATKRPMTLAEYKAKNEKANKDTRSPVAKAVGWDANKTQFIRDLLTGGNDVAGRGMIAGMLGAPGDIAGLAENSLRGLIGKPQVQPWGGSEHIGQTLEQAGLVSDVRRPKTELLASLISPGAAAKTVLNAPKTAMTALRWMDNLDSAPTMARMGQRGAIDVWHGSPSEFERFSSAENAGSGTGGGIYGSGGYHSSSQDVAKTYRARNSATASFKYNGKPITDDIKGSVAWHLEHFGGDKDAVKAYWVESRKPSYWETPAGKKELATLEKMDYGKLSAGNLYRNQLRWPDPAKEASDPLGDKHFLDYDKPLIEQPEVLAKLKESGLLEKSMKQGGFYQQDIPSGLFKGEHMLGMNGSRGRYGNPLDSQELYQAGIPGIRYLDEEASSAGAGTHNYVTFDDSLVNILERNGQPVTAPQPGLLGKMVAPQDEALRVAQALPDNAPMTKLYVSMGGQRFPADNMLDAARKYDMYREQANAGASMLPPVDIVDEAGNVLANFSYNGRLWKGERGAAERIEIDPANWDDR